jgi:hypothetical protein
VADSEHIINIPQFQIIYCQFPKSLFLLKKPLDLGINISNQVLILRFHLTRSGFHFQYGYDFMGNQTVKNIAKPVGAYRVLMDRRVTLRENPQMRNPQLCDRCQSLLV